MSQGRNPNNGETSCKDTESPNPPTAAEPVKIERLASNGEQTLLTFSGESLDGCCLALPDGDLDVDDAREIASGVVAAARGVGDGRVDRDDLATDGGFGVTD